MTRQSGTWTAAPAFAVVAPVCAARSICRHWSHTLQRRSRRKYRDLRDAGKPSKGCHHRDHVRKLLILANARCSATAGNGTKKPLDQNGYYAAAVLVARMEDAALDRAVVWDDGTFDGRPWRGAVDIPQRGISVPAVQRGGQAPRRGGPTPPLAARGTDHRRVRTPFVFLENVAHHLRLGFPRGRRRTGRHGLPACGRPLHGGGGRRVSARAALHPRPPRGRRAPTRPGWPTPVAGDSKGTRNRTSGGRSRRGGITTG